MSDVGYYGNDPVKRPSDPLISPSLYGEQPSQYIQRGVEEADERETGWAASLTDQSKIETSRCPICFQLLKEPYLTDCCGSHYCRVCIEHWLTENDFCPICRKTNVTIFPNLAKQREIMDLVVYCSNKQKGCKWSGELRDLQDHLHTNCSYALYSCKWGCGTVLMGIQMDQHQLDCPNLPKDSLVPVLRDQHRKLHAEMRLLRNKNDRLEAENRKLKGQIIEMQESQETIMLQLSEGRGRNDELKRQVGVLSDELKKLATKVGQGGGTLSNGYNEKDKSLEKLQQYTDHQHHIIKQLQFRLEKSIRLSGLAPPRILVMTDYSKYKANNRWWQSDPFYSNPCGYKMRMEIRAAGNGGGAGTHVSLYIHLMAGEFDDLLTWPLAADVHFKLINHFNGGKHFESKVSFTQSNEASYQVAEGKLTGTGRGYAQFLSHGAVNQDNLKGTQYLKNDSLHFEIFKVVVFCMPQDGHQL